MTDIEVYQQLKVAILLSDIELFDMLINNELDPYHVYTDGTCLSYAISVGSNVMVKYIYDRYKDQVHFADSDGITPIMIAIQNSRVDYIKYFVDNGLDINKKYNEMTMIGYAVKYNNIYVLEFLIDIGCDMTPGIEGMNLLHMAIYNGNEAYDIINILTDHFEKRETTDDSLDALDIAVNNKDIEIIRLLIRKSYPIEKHPYILDTYPVIMDDINEYVHIFGNIIV